MKKLLINALAVLLVLSAPLSATDNQDTGLQKEVLTQDSQPGNNTNTKNSDSWWSRHGRKVYYGAGALALGAAGYYGYQKYMQNQKQYQLERDNRRVQDNADYFARQEQNRVLDSLKYPSNMTADDFRTRRKQDLHSTTFRDLRNTEQWLKERSEYDPSKTNQQFMDDSYKEQSAKQHHTLRHNIHKRFPSETASKKPPTRIIQSRELSEHDLKRQERQELGAIDKEMKRENLTKDQKKSLEQQKRAVKSHYFNEVWKIKENKKKQEKVEQKNKAVETKEQQTYLYRREQQRNQRNNTSK